MNNKRRYFPIAYFSIVAATLCLVASLASAQESGDSAASMSPEQAEMMQAWAEAMQPGSEHERLAESVGEWDATVKAWMAPGGEPSTSEATVSRSMSLGGRVLVEEWQGLMMGQDFIGHGRTGFNNVTGKYWSTWTDNMSTGLMAFDGTYDAEANRYTFTGSYADPVSGEMIESRSVSYTDDQGREVMEMYETRGGEEIKTMEMTLQRR